MAAGYAPRHSRGVQPDLSPHGRSPRSRLSGEAKLQFTKPFKQAIAAGDVTCSFRTWKRSQVKVGGQYNIVPFGAIEVTAVETVLPGAITNRDARAAGHPGLDALLAFLKTSPTDPKPLYRVDFRFLGAAPVNQPDRSSLDETELRVLIDKLEATDRRSKTGPWTFAVLAAIDADPGRRAGDLAPRFGMETPKFKANVRRLKQLGLTVSLEVGYRLSERGGQVLAAHRNTSARKRGA